MNAPTKTLPLAPSPLDAWLTAQCDGLLSPDAPLTDERGTSSSLPRRVQAAQFAALKATLRYARQHSRYYGRTLAAYDIELVRPEDLQALPFTTPHDLREYRDFLCVPQGHVQRIVTLQTSGSTGAPKRVAFSAADLARTASFFAVGMTQLVQPGQRLLVLLPGAACPDGVADVLRQALAPQGVTVNAGQPQITPDSLCADLQTHHPHCLVAAPHQLQVLWQAVRQDATLCALAQCVRGIQSSGDILDAEVRDGLEASLDCLVLDHYGLTETGFGGGVQCRARSGYHLRELDIFIEILDPASGEYVPDGSVGEVVLTTLQREAMPLIRYRTGDAAAWLTGSCPCGSPMRRLSPIQGRYFYENGVYTLRRVRKGGFDARSAPSALC